MNIDKETLCLGFDCVDNLEHELLLMLRRLQHALQDSSTRSCPIPEQLFLTLTLKYSWILWLEVVVEKYWYFSHTLSHCKDALPSGANSKARLRHVEKHSEYIYTNIKEVYRRLFSKIYFIFIKHFTHAQIQSSVASTEMFLHSWRADLLMSLQP